MENQYYRRDIALFIGDVPFMPPKLSTNATITKCIEKKQGYHAT